MFCYCGGKLDLWCDNFVCDKCNIIFTKCDNDIYKSGAKLYKKCYFDAKYTEILLPLDKEDNILLQKYTNLSKEEIEELYKKHTNEDKCRDYRTVILEYLGLTDRYKYWISNEFEYPDIDMGSESGPDDFLMFFEEEFRNKIRCEKCGSIIDARNWRNLEGYKERPVIGIRRFQETYKANKKISCPICGNMKEIE